jgi:hypothetical protein
MVVVESFRDQNFICSSWVKKTRQKEKQTERMDVSEKTRPYVSFYRRTSRLPISVQATQKRIDRIGRSVAFLTVHVNAHGRPMAVSHWPAQPGHYFFLFFFG